MLYVDESIQSDLGYICVGFAFCKEDPSFLIEKALRDSGFEPSIDEYKSGYRMNDSKSKEKHQLRDAIQDIICQHCKIGVYIASSNERPQLLEHIEKCSRLMIQNNKLEKPQRIFVDGGILGFEINDDEIILKNNCDSKNVFGIQLADYVAYHCSLLLKARILGFSKEVLITDSPHPLENEMVELNWLIRTNLRRNFFCEYRDIEKIEGDDWMFTVSEYGFFCSSNLDPEVKKKAEETFKEMYWGCVF